MLLNALDNNLIKICISNRIRCRLHYELNSDSLFCQRGCTLAMVVITCMNVVKFKLSCLAQMLTAFFSDVITIFWGFTY